MWYLPIGALLSLVLAGVVHRLQQRYRQQAALVWNYNWCKHRVEYYNDQAEQARKRQAAIQAEMDSLQEYIDEHERTITEIESIRYWVDLFEHTQISKSKREIWKDNRWRLG